MDYPSTQNSEYVDLVVESYSKPLQLSLNLEYKTEKGFIYAVRAKEQPICKIGHTYKGNSRVRCIKDWMFKETGSQGIVCAFRPGTIQEEQSLHKRFAYLRYAARCSVESPTEWYQLSGEVLDWVKRHSV